MTVEKISKLVGDIYSLCNKFRFEISVSYFPNSKNTLLILTTESPFFADYLQKLKQLTIDDDFNLAVEYNHYNGKYSLCVFTSPF